VKAVAFPSPSDVITSDVITGLVPVISIGKARRLTGRDGRVKPGHDVERRSGAVFR
jgi:hypothetical protein